MCNTRIFFRSPSNEAAVWTSKELGQHEIEEMKEGISYSESAMRSGISINKQMVKKDLVSPAEIMRLHALEAYIRLPGELPITKIKLKYKDRSTDIPPFIAREIVEKPFGFFSEEKAPDGNAAETPKLQDQKCDKNLEKKESAEELPDNDVIELVPEQQKQKMLPQTEKVDIGDIEPDMS